MMRTTEKQLSNPFSTGGGGVAFENHVQTSFVVLMLTGGYIPCLSCCQIKKIQLQGKCLGYQTDDIIIFAEQQGTLQKSKLLGQIKHSIGITIKNPLFGEVIRASWRDFRDPSHFTLGRDAIALITGPLSDTDTYDVRTILEWARHLGSADEFLTRVGMTRFSSHNKRNKLNAFRSQLMNANDGHDVGDEQVFQFLRHFHLVGYDLDIKSGVTLSLLHSLIGQYSPENVQALWAQIADEVQSTDQNAGAITPYSLPDDIISAFKQRAIEKIMPFSLSPIQVAAGKLAWSQQIHAPQLALANLLGSWNEQVSGDHETVSQLVKQDYNDWILKIEDMLLDPEAPIKMKNGVWVIKDRKVVWQELGARLFDSHLDNLKQIVPAVLTELDPRFDLPPEERYLAVIRGKVLQHSQQLRKGLAGTLALLGNESEVLKNCALGKAESTAVLVVRLTLAKTNWKLWGSLSNILPDLAEAAPDEFLNSIEADLEVSPSTVDELFLQEGKGPFDENYLTGLLWALETLAWEDRYLVRATSILGELASRDPGGNWANRPINSLITIFLPWLPQTIAPFERRKVALQTLQKYSPAIARKVLLALLPGEHQTSFGTRKPAWRHSIPGDWSEKVGIKEYADQTENYAKMAVEMAEHDTVMLNELIAHLNRLPPASLEKILGYLTSQAIIDKPEEERSDIWTALVDLVSKHRKYAESKWAFSPELVSKIESASKALAPTNIINLHSRLFSSRDMDLYAGKENCQAEQAKLEERRQKAVKEIAATQGVKGLFCFIELVDSPFKVGVSLGWVADSVIDSDLLPRQLDIQNVKLNQFARGFVLGRFSSKGWSWVDGLSISEWSQKETTQLFTYLPFTPETWKRVSKLLGNSDRLYWENVVVEPFTAPTELTPAIDKLLEYDRPNAAIYCIHTMVYERQPLDEDRSINALLAAVTSPETANTLDVYNTVELIKALQESKTANPDLLLQIEWAYLQLLVEEKGITPRLLENKLSTDPRFFHEVISWIYYSKNEQKNERIEKNPQEKAYASNAFRLLNQWHIPPGIKADGSFSEEAFNDWLKQVKILSAQSGHTEIALLHVGNVLIFSPPALDKLWINHAVAEALDSIENEKMRRGFSQGVSNARGVHWVDPSGKQELELASTWKKKAEDVENAGYTRFASELYKLADSYYREAKWVVDEHKRDMEDHS
jgi:hypothetical protein